jgi:acyl dehydratase
MPIDYDALMARRFPEVEHAYTGKDVILYALGVGLGFDPGDESQIPFVYEEGLRALPTMATVLAWPGLWIREPDTGLDWEKVVHGEQGLDLHAPLATEGTVVARTRVTGIVDKGPGRGALVYTERTGLDKASGRPLFTVRHTAFARGDGGFGGPGHGARAPHPLPRREPDAVCDLPTVPQQALLYRLNGDPNPHNAVPHAARAAGFAGPILHGLCTYGIVGHAVLRTLCGYDPGRLRGLDVRLTAPAYPGETLRTELWVDGDVVSLCASSVERGVRVLDNGRAVVAPAG